MYVIAYCDPQWKTMYGQKLKRYHNILQQEHTNNTCDDIAKMKLAKLYLVFNAYLVVLGKMYVHVVFQL